MKRPAKDVISSDDSSDSDSDKDNKFGLPIKTSKSEVISRKKKLAFDVLSKHGYRGGPSVLKVPAPKEPEKEQDWSWSTGKDQNTSQNNDDDKESIEERERTRAALMQGEKLVHVQTKKDKEDNKSFNQKEKRKRDLGQASRGKNYVEEEKRLLRESGVYSGFDA
ncbi:hypothetical protein LUZ60_006672 [Juncus effusus]|nr:hypothetical protein LUZ60_006672 [Juncus effusus]